jgi:hypothetical protein
MATHRQTLSASSAILAVMLFALVLLVVSLTAPPAHSQYGPDTCAQGYVWREAYPDDHVCVRPEVRAQAAADNAAAAGNRQPGGGPYGPETCRQGLVWREARPGDQVCVPPATREQAAMDNARAAERRADAGDIARFWKPTWGGGAGDRLDWCREWGVNCGEPVAIAYCQRRRYQRVVSFEPDRVGRSAQTRLLGTNETCNGDFCTAFAHITCADSFPAARVFVNPSIDGHRLDNCRQWATDCGKPAADAFCAQSGFSSSVQHLVDAEPGYSKTKVISSGQICDGGGCRGFQQIICQ